MNKRARNKTEKESYVKYKIDYSESKSISTWGYVGYSLLWLFIPVIGLISWICSCFSKNKNVKNYAIAQGVFVVLFALLVFAACLLIKLDVITVETIKSVGNQILSYIK